MGFGAELLLEKVFPVIILSFSPGSSIVVLLIAIRVTGKGKVHVLPLLQQRVTVVVHKKRLLAHFTI
jgi:hypothetical protein